MNNGKNLSTKHNLIDRSNRNMFIVVAIAGVLLSFTIVASIAMSQRMSYQGKVISARDRADKQLQANLKAVTSLMSSYQSFDSAAESVIGSIDPNSKVVLDALPSKYDFPALTNSLQAMMNNAGLSGITISGTDDEATAEQNSQDPKPVEIPISFSGRGSYDNVKKFVDTLQLSIRPFKVTKLNISGSQGAITVTVTAVTYYQPSRSLDIPLKEVK